MPEREQALRELLRLEAGRLALLPSGSDLILADRSVHTLLAHSYALEQLTGIGVFDPSVRMLRASPLAAWPELVLYLELPQPAVEGRNNGKVPPRTIHTDPGIHAAIRSYSPPPSGSGETEREPFMHAFRRVAQTSCPTAGSGGLERGAPDPSLRGVKRWRRADTWRPLPAGWD